MEAKKFECNVMFGDADLTTHLEFTSDSLAECQLLEYYLEVYQSHLYNFLSEDKYDEKKELVSICNELSKLIDKVEHNYEDDTKIENCINIEDLYYVFVDIVSDIESYFEWSFREIEYWGKIQDYKVTILEKKIMTREEVKRFIYDELKQEIEIID